MPNLDDAPEPVKIGIQTALQSFEVQVDLSQLNDSYLQRTDDVLSFSRGLLVLYPAAPPEVVERVFSSAINTLKNPETTLDSAVALWRFLDTSQQSLQTPPLLPSDSPRFSVRLENSLLGSKFDRRLCR